MPIEVIHAFAILKKAAALTNAKLGVLDEKKARIISAVCEEILLGQWDEEFPLVVWQTGSGTQTNMNANEVIAHRAHVRLGGSLSDKVKHIHPNDDVNCSQSSNDTFPTAMHIAAYRLLSGHTLPLLEDCRKSMASKAEDFATIVKIGRTHCMDATPLTLGQEFSGYATQLSYGIKALEGTLPHLSALALGGTAVGTGLEYAKRVCRGGGEANSVANGGILLSVRRINLKPWQPMMPSLNLMVLCDQIAVSINKIGNDIRLLGSGPRCGIGELILPANEPGSSIMPGKVNPTQCEALTMVCAQIIGNDAAIACGGMQGHFELNTFKPMMIANFIHSARLLGDACCSFQKNCLSGIEANKTAIKANLERSLMLITALNPHIGYENAAKNRQKSLCRKYHAHRKPQKALQLVKESDFDTWVNPKNMLGEKK